MNLDGRDVKLLRVEFDAMPGEETWEGSGYRVPMRWEATHWSEEAESADYHVTGRVSRDGGDEKKFEWTTCGCGA